MLEEPGWSIRLRFNGELSAQSPRRTVQRLFSYLVLERLPTPGLALSGWEGRPLTPSSHVEQGCQWEGTAWGSEGLQHHGFALSQLADWPWYTLAKAPMIGSNSLILPRQSTSSRSPFGTSLRYLQLTTLFAPSSPQLHHQQPPMPGLFQTITLYVRIRKDQFDIRNPATDQRTIARSLQGFSTERLLIGNFTEAEATLMKAVKELQKPSLFQSPPGFLLLHPLEIISGGLSQVEDRVLRDLAATCGRSCDVWMGDELSDEEVLERARRA